MFSRLAGEIRLAMLPGESNQPVKYVNLRYAIARLLALLGLVRCPVLNMSEMLLLRSKEKIQRAFN